MNLRALFISALTVFLLTNIHASPLEADFKQPDTAAPDGGWGAEWKIEGAPVFRQGGMGKKQSDGQTVAIHEQASLPNDSFILSADVYAQANDRWVGLVFDFLSPETYAVWRVKFSENSAFEPTPWQLLQVRDGKSTVVQQGTISPGGELADPAPLKTWRRLQVERDDDGKYVARVLSDLESTPATWSTDLKWKEDDKGRGGLFFSNGFVWVRSFSVSPGQ